MKKDLPKVFANNIEKEINNQKEVFYGNETLERKDNTPINIKINRIFNKSDYVYKKEVTIVTSNKTFNKTIIGKTSKHLLTLDNEKIEITSIIDIYEK